MTPWREDLKAAIDEAGDQRPPVHETPHPPHPLHPTLIEAMYDVKQALAGFAVPANVRESSRRNGGTLDIWSPEDRELKIVLLLQDDKLRVSSTYRGPFPWINGESDVTAETSKDALAGEIVAIYRQFLMRADELNAPEPPLPDFSAEAREIMRNILRKKRQRR